MKKLFLFLAMSGLVLSCSSDSSSGPSLSSTPDAKAQYDDSSFGVYKGIFVGSSGTVFIDVYNNGAAVAILTIDGTAKNYTATEKVAEDSAIEGLTFTNGSNSFDFNVDGDGSDPYVSNINISGHPSSNIAVVKELSNSLVQCYTGSYSGDDTGTLNLVSKGNSLDGLAKSNGEDYSISLSGSLSGNAIAGIFEGGSFSGTKNGNRISGTWQNDSAESGSWSGTRKL